MVNESNMSIGNKYGDCVVCCYNCGSVGPLFQVAHRNEDGGVTGYLFLCSKCHPHIIGWGVKLVELEALKDMAGYKVALLAHYFKLQKGSI